MAQSGDENIPQVPGGVRTEWPDVTALRQVRRLHSEPFQNSKGVFEDEDSAELAALPKSWRPASTISFALGGKDINFDAPFNQTGVTATLYNHRSFRKPCEEISQPHIQSPYIRTLIKFLKEKCDENGFIAVSAIQFGINLDLFVYRIPPKEVAGEAYEHLYGEGEGEMVWQVCINSSWRPHRDSVEFQSREGSFARKSSLDEIHSGPVEVTRHDKIIASWTNEHGKVIKTKLPKFAGNVFQNKVDYNKGKTQVDRHSAMGQSSDQDLQFDSQEAPPPELMGDAFGAAAGAGAGAAACDADALS